MKPDDENTRPRLMLPLQQCLDGEWPTGIQRHEIRELDSVGAFKTGFRRDGLDSQGLHPESRGWSVRRPRVATASSDCWRPRTQASQRTHSGLARLPG